MGIRSGEPLPLMLQLYDGDDNRTVECVVRLDDGTEHALVRLPHLAQGFYASADVRMPDGVVFVTAQYTVLDSDDYEIVSETFYRDRTPEASLEGASEALKARDEERDARRSGFMSGRVIDTRSGDFIEGRVHASQTSVTE